MLGRSIIFTVCSEDFQKENFDLLAEYFEANMEKYGITPSFTKENDSGSTLVYTFENIGVLVDSLMFIAKQALARFNAFKGDKYIDKIQIAEK